MNGANTSDSEIFDLLEKERKRQQETISLIPSENYISKEIRTALGSILSNKYSEGYPGKKYYQGNEYVERAESLAIERAKKLFNVPCANVQALSGAAANTAVYFALLSPGDVLMGMSLPFGGHLTHGHPDITFSGKYFSSVSYTTNADGFIDYENLEKTATEIKPKLIISGASAYPRKIDFKKFGEIADKVGAWHVADISHIAGLVVAGEHESPVEYADVVTTTTHKTLRGPRGALIMATNKGVAKDAELGSSIDKAVFPGIQGGPHMQSIAGIAICLKEAMSPEFKTYAHQVVLNCRTLADELKSKGFNLLTQGTDNHLVLVNILNKGVDGWAAAWSLEYAGLTVNRNTIPFETKSPFYPSGIRLGTPAVTTRGMKENEMKIIAEWVNRVMKAVSENNLRQNTDTKFSKQQRDMWLEKIKTNTEIAQIKKEVKVLCEKFPIPTTCP